MDLFNQKFMYEFHARELLQQDALKQYADHAVKDIKSHYGWDTDVQINIEPEAKDKKLFSVSMSVFGLAEPTSGRNHSFKRTVLMKINELVIVPVAILAVLVL
ncbi:MAG: hypothetical protein J7501_06895 [Bdellovibrio sp.]|nr:hypothetical protein [Bdellovibrio sp.]